MTFVIFGKKNMPFNFFNNSKRKDKGSLSYLKYAFGEIILVAFGILIAVQVNNFNEAKKNKKIKYEFLENLKEEVILDTLQLSEKIDDFKSINESVLKGVLLLEKTEHTDSEKKDFKKAIKILRVLTPLNKSTTKNDNKISSGIIESNELNKLLSEYYEKINFHKAVMSKFGETLQLIYVSQISPFIKFRYKNDFEYSLKLIKNNNAFNNALIISLNTRSRSIEWLENQKIEATQLLNFIEKQLLISKP
jgi:hypothetical protein